MLRKALDHADRILEPVPSRHLSQHPVAGGERTRLDRLGLAIHAARRAVGTLERGGRVTVLRCDACRAQYRRHGLSLERRVLRREGVDRGRDDREPGLVEVIPNE